MKKSLTLLSTLLMVACSDSSSSKKNMAPTIPVHPVAPITQHHQNYIPDGYYISESINSNVKALVIYNSPQGPIAYWLTTSNCNTQGFGYLMFEQGGLQYSRSNFQGCSTFFNAYSNHNAVMVSTTTHSQMYGQQQEDVRMTRVENTQFYTYFRTYSNQADHTGTDYDACFKVFGKGCADTEIYDEKIDIPVSCTIGASTSSVSINDSGYTKGRNFDYLRFTVIEDRPNHYSIKPLSEDEINRLLTGKSNPNQSILGGILGKIMGSISQNRVLVSTITIQGTRSGRAHVVLQRPGKSDETLNLNSLLNKGVMRNIKGVDLNGKIIDVAAYIKCERN